MRHPILSINNITKSYSCDKEVLKKISFEAYASEYIGLIGHNGAGKTSLIHIIAGVLKPTSGSVNINTSNNRNIAWVSQQTTINWYLNVLDNVRLGARLGGYSFAASKQRALECLKLVELEEELYTPADCLSVGQQKRVQIARALAQSAKILILDEPTTGLDVSASQKLLIALKNISNNGGLVILSSHDLSLIESYVDRILYLNKGQLVVDDTISSFIKNHTKPSEIKITYLGEIGYQALQDIECVCKVITVNPLTIVINSSYSLGAILNKLNKQIEILNISHTPSGLKEAYQSFLIQ